MSQEVPVLGKLLDNTARRDAIHVAIAPVVAGHALKPGEHVGLTAGGEAVTGVEPIGIVDPFLTKWVMQGEKFWLCLYPNTVTSIRHMWTHPAFASFSAIAKG